MTSTETNSGNQNLAVLLELEAGARRAESRNALQFHIVNETRRLVSYRQAFFVSAAGDTQHRVEAASSLSIVDRNTPLISWIEFTADALAERGGVAKTMTLDSSSLASEEVEAFNKFSLPYVLFCPMQMAEGTRIGGLWLARETQWQDSEIVLIERLAETYAHAMNALLGGKPIQRITRLTKQITIGVAVAVVIAALVPVRMSTIAPVEIVPLEPLVVSAPMDGVIKEVVHPANTTVEAGELLFRFEDTSHRNRQEIAEQSYQVAGARLRQATQGAFQDEAAKGQVTLLRAELSLKQAELEYANEILTQVEVTAQAGGLLVYSDESDWAGRPVAVGEKIMEIVDPQRVQFKIDLPVEDAIVLETGAEVEIFLHADPLTPLKAIVTRSTFNAAPTPAGVLAYRVHASAEGDETPGRIGLQGSARVYGESVSMLFYVFRRPLTTARQFLGL